MDKKVKITTILPLLLSFFVMSFVDIVGISKDLVNEDLHLSEFILGFIPFAAFVWFFILSVPTGIFQSRFGKKLTLNIGMVITGVGLLFPFFVYNFVTVIIAFTLLGIGNTIIQVSANPLLVDVVPKSRASSYLSFSQFVKAIGSMIAPFLATQFAVIFNDWKILFLVFGIVSLLSVLWLSTIKVEESKNDEVKATFTSCFKLLGDNFVLMMVLSIFLVVGIDVGFNTHSSTFLVNQFGFESDESKIGRSIYFFGRMLGTFAGAILLTRISSRKFFMWSSLLGILFLVLMLIMKSHFLGWALVFLVGLAVANIWPLVFSIAIERHPSRGNEISGLMMMAISGGAVIPFLIGWFNEMSGIILGMSVLIACMVYLFAVSLYCLKR
jgi:MFS transporter, FHS family, L-fucose permease